MATWHEITRDPEYQELSEQGKALVKQGFFEREISSDPEFKAFSPQTQKAVFDDFWQTPDDSGQGIVTSTLGSAARGFGEIIPGTLEGVGALTGITPISDLGESAREGLEYIAPVNPIYEQGIPAKVANVAGNVASIIGTSGVGGLAGKALGAERAAAAGSAAARQALTNQAIQAGAKSALYGTGFAQGAAAKAAENERLGITGAEGYLNLLGGGISELAPEMLPLGSALETSAARRLLGGVDDAAGRVIPGIRMSAAQEAAEGGSTQVLSNLSTQLTAPTGVEAPGLFEGAGEAALWEGVGGAMFGAINKLGRTPPERQTAEQKAYAAELGAIPVDRKPPITPEESLENFNQGGISVVSSDGVVTTLPFNRENIRATNLPFNRDDIRATDLPFSREDIRPTKLPFNREDIRATELPFSRQNIRGLSQLGQPVPSPSQVIADTLLTNAVNVSSDATKATEAALAVVQGVAATAPVGLPVPTVEPTVETPSPAMEQIETPSQTITGFNGEIAPEMSVPPPTAEAGAGAGEAPVLKPTSGRKPVLAPQVQEMLAQAAAINAGTQTVAPSTNEFVQKMTGQTPAKPSEDKIKRLTDDLAFSGVGEIDGVRYAIQASPDGTFYVQKTTNGVREALALGQPDISTANQVAIQIASNEYQDVSESSKAKEPAAKSQASESVGSDKEAKAGSGGMSVEEAKAYLNRPGQILGFDEPSFLDSQRQKGKIKPAPPITPTKETPTPATEGTVMPGGSAMERDVTKPATVKSTELRVGDEVSFKGNTYRVKSKLLDGRVRAEFTNPEGIAKLPAGSVNMTTLPRNVNLTRIEKPSPQTTTVVTPTETAAPLAKEAAVASVVQQPAEGSIPAVEQESATTAIESNEKADIGYGAKLNSARNVIRGLGPDSIMAQQQALNSLLSMSVAELQSAFEVLTGDTTKLANKRQLANNILNEILGQEQSGESSSVSQIFKESEKEAAVQEVVDESTDLNPITDEMVESSLTPVEKREAAIILGKKTWADSKALFKQRMADWMAGANETSKKLIKFFKTVANKARLLLAASIGLSMANSTSDVNLATSDQFRAFKIPVSSILNSKPARPQFGSLPDMSIGIPEQKIPLGLSNVELNKRPKIDTRGKKISSDAAKTAQWVLDTADSEGYPFIVTDKIGATMYFFDEKGVLLKKSPVLVGKNVGDFIGNTDAGRITPSGRFEIAPETDATYGNVFSVMGTDMVDSETGELVEVAIHRLALHDPSEKRPQRIATATPLDNRISWGCMNLDNKVMDWAFNNYPLGGLIYILPETAKGRSVFAPLNAANIESSKQLAKNSNVDLRDDLNRKEDKKLEAAQKKREELNLKTLNSLIQKTRTNVVQGTVKATDANQAVAILNRSGEIPNVLFTWIGTSKDFLADPANRVRYPETWAAISANSKIEGMSENGQPIVFTDNVGVSDLDRKLANLQGTTPEVAAVRRVILHENIHKGMFFLSMKEKMQVFAFLRRMYSPDELDSLAKSYSEYSDWRTNQVSYFSILEEAMTRDFDSMVEIPRDGIWAEFMQFLRGIWQKITGKTSEPTLKDYKDVFRLIRNSLKNSEKANADMLVNGGGVRMSMSEFLSNVTPEQDAEYMAAVEAGDVAKQQAMVDAAAKAAGYNVGPVWHGSPETFLSFAREKLGSLTKAASAKLAFFFASEKRNSMHYAAQWQEQNGASLESLQALSLRQGEESLLRQRIKDGKAEPETINAIEAVDMFRQKFPASMVKTSDMLEYLKEIDLPYKITNGTLWVYPFSTGVKVYDTVSIDRTAITRAIFQDAALKLSQRIGEQSGRRPSVRPFYLGGKTKTISFGGSGTVGKMAKAVSAAQKEGFDVLEVTDTKDPFPTNVYAVFDPNQIKSAEPITRDDQGNVIPLSRRFQSASNDIRFSKVDDSQVIPLDEAIQKIESFTEDNEDTESWPDDVTKRFEESEYYQAIENGDTAKAWELASGSVRDAELAPLVELAKKANQYGQAWDATSEKLRKAGKYSIENVESELGKTLPADVVEASKADLSPLEEWLSSDEVLADAKRPFIEESGARIDATIKRIEDTGKYTWDGSVFEPVSDANVSVRFSKVEYDSPNDAAFNSGAEVARNTDYDERDKEVRSTIRAAYDITPKTNGPSVPLDELFSIVKQSMPDVTETEFSRILQGLYEDSGALLIEGESPFATFTTEGERAGSVIVMPPSVFQTKAMASIVDSQATEDYRKDVDAANTGKAKAPFGGVQFTNFMPIDRTVKSAEEYSDAAIKYVNNLEKEGVSLDDIANSVISPAFLESIGIEQDLMAQDALTIEVRQRVDNAAREEKSPGRKKQLSKLSERLSAFWQGVGSKKGQHLGQRRYLVNKARYSWMFIREIAEKAMKEARTNILISNFGSENATSFTQNSYENSDKANQQAVDENINAAENDAEWSLIQEGVQILEGEAKSIWQRMAQLLRRFAFYARRKTMKAANAKASMTDAERNELNAILQMSDEEAATAEAKDLAEFIALGKRFLGEESAADTPEKKTVRKKREKMVEVAKKRADKGLTLESLESDSALSKMLREINRARPGEQAPLSKQIPWRQLLSQSAKTVEEYRQRIFDAISANEELKNATPEQKERLADLFAEAWETNRTRILDGMLERMIRAEEAKKNLSKEGAKALQAQRMRIVEDINLGIFDNDELAKRMAEKFGIKSEFTETEREKINSLIEVLQDEGLNAVKRQVAAYKLLEVLQGELKIPVVKMIADFWVSSVLSGPNTIVSIGLAVASGAFELSTALSRVFIAGFTNQKQLPSELAGAYKTLARLLSAYGRQARIAWQYLVSGDPVFLDPSMNDVTENMQWGNIGKSNKLAEQMAKSDKILVKSAGLFMRTVSRLLTALDVFNSGLTKEGSLSIVFRQIGLDPAKIAEMEKKSDLKPYKDAIIQKNFGGTPPKSARDKAILDSYALADMMAELDKLGNVSENANFFGQQGAMTLDPSGLGGVGYRAIRSLVTNAEAGADRFLKQAQRGWNDSAQNGDRILSGLELAFAYFMQFAAYNAANFGGVRFARFAGNKFNQGLSFIPGIGFARAFEAEFDPNRISGKEAFIDSIRRNQLIGVMLSVAGYQILKAIADEPDDEKRGWFINGSWGNLTPEKKQQKLAAGEKEYTIGINGKVFNYANWPISSVLASIGSLSDLIRFSPDQWNDKNVAQIMASAAMSGAAAAADIPALSQFQEIFGNSLSSKDPNEKRMERFAKVMSSYAGGFVPRFLKDIDYAQDPNLRKYETLWEKTASHIPVYRRYEGKEYYDILGQQIQRNVYPGSREFMVKPTDPAYKVLGALNSRGIWLTPANAEHRMVGKGARRRSLTQEEADNYSLETGKGYKQMLLRYGQRALQMPTERARAFLLDKADEVRDRALKKVYRGYQPAT